MVPLALWLAARPGRTLAVFESASLPFTRHPLLAWQAGGVVITDKCATLLQVLSSGAVDACLRDLLVDGRFGYLVGVFQRDPAPPSYRALTALHVLAVSGCLELQLQATKKPLISQGLSCVYWRRGRQEN